MTSLSIYWQCFLVWECFEHRNLFFAIFIPTFYNVSTDNIRTIAIFEGILGILIKLTVDFIGSIQLWKNNLSLVNPTHPTPTSFGLISMINVIIRGWKLGFFATSVLFCLWFIASASWQDGRLFNLWNRKRQSY